MVVRISIHCFYLEKKKKSFEFEERDISISLNLWFGTYDITSNFFRQSYLFNPSYHIVFEIEKTVQLDFGKYASVISFNFFRPKKLLIITIIKYSLVCGITSSCENPR